MTNMSSLWLHANYARLQSDTHKFLRLKLKSNFVGTDITDMLHDYYVVACTNDRLSSRLEISESGEVVEITGKEITASRLALYCYNAFLDGLDKSLRKNVGLAQDWEGVATTKMKAYPTPPTPHFEAFGDSSGEQPLRVIGDTTNQPDEGHDDLCDEEHEALLDVLVALSGDLTTSGQPLPTPLSPSMLK